MNAYFPMSTQNPTGIRPWNFSTQTAPTMGRLRGLGRLGRLGVNMLAAMPASAQQQVSDIINYLKQAQSDINATNQAILQGNAQGVDMSDVAAQNNANQQQLTTLTNEFTIGYRAMTGSVPPGLSGLGQVDPVSWTTIAGAIAALAILSAAAYALIQQTSANKMNAQAKLTTSQTVQSSINTQNSLLAQAAQQYAAGNTQQGDMLNALAAQAGAAALTTGTPPGSFDLGTWLSNNSTTVAIVVAVALLGPTLVKKLF